MTDKNLTNCKKVTSVIGMEEPKCDKNLLRTDSMYTNIQFTLIGAQHKTTIETFYLVYELPKE